MRKKNTKNFVCNYTSIKLLNISNLYMTKSVLKFQNLIHVWFVEIILKIYPHAANIVNAKIPMNNYSPISIWNYQVETLGWLP
jgi:hypothetical protein